MYLLMVSYYRDLKERVLENISRMKTTTGDLIDQQAEVEKLMALTFPAFKRASVAVWNQRVEFYGTDEIYPEFEMYENTRAFVSRVCRLVTATTAKKLSQLIIEKKDLIINTKDLSESVSQYFDNNSQSRSKSMSDSEINGIAGMAIIALFLLLRKKGKAHHRRWVAVRDGGTRQTHIHADGQIIEITGTYVVGNQRARYPGDPQLSEDERMGCRCTEEIVD